MTHSLPPLLAKLSALKPELARRFGVSGVAVFGSYARGEARPESDLDLLLDFAADAAPDLLYTRPSGRFSAGHSGCEGGHDPARKPQPTHRALHSVGADPA